MNLPNKITLARIVLTFFFVAFLLMKGFSAKAIALGIFVFAAITDYLDGWIAKRNNLVSNFGRIMDPVADKALTISAFVTFSFMGIVPSKIVVIIILREVLVTSLRLKALMDGKVLSAASAGRKKTFSQMISIFVILVFILMKEGGNKVFPFWTSDVEYYFSQGILVLMIITAIFTVISGFSYFYDNRKYLFGDGKGAN